jgi:SAM-dependent methyltransferase
MSGARDVATRETATFVLAHLDGRHRRVLEVGCGRGDVAAEIARAGHEVVGVDSDAESVAAARARGVDARHVAWLEFGECAAFDAVVFTCSLHHLLPLDESVARARACLAPDGVVLVEDFAFHKADAPTVAWFCQQAERIADVLGAGAAPEDCFAARLVRGGPAAWYAGHDERLHSAEAMEAALAATFAPPRTAAAPYLYRYVIDLVSETPEGAQMVRRTLAAERSAAAAGLIRLIGRRFVARPRES